MISSKKMKQVCIFKNYSPSLITMNHTFRTVLGLLLIVFLFSTCKEDEKISVLESTTIEQQKTWTWIDNANMVSRAGEIMGYGASLNTESKKLLIYLEGGGACFNGLTCVTNPSGADVDTEIENVEGLNKRIMSRSNPGNRFKDWNFVYVPYVTGDVHMGNNPDADLPDAGPSSQKMMGYANVTAIVNDLVEYARRNEFDEILVTGISAGGFGVYLSFLQVADAFPNAQLTGLVDSGPIFLDTSLFTECFDDIINNTWKTPLPTDTDAYVDGSYTYVPQAIYEYMGNKYPNANFGLMSNYSDTVIRYFYGYPKSGCNALPGLVTENEFRDGLMEIKAVTDNLPNWSVYFTEGTGHTYLGGGTYENTSVDGKALNDWVEDITLGEHESVVE